MENARDTCQFASSPAAWDDVKRHRAQVRSLVPACRAETDGSIPWLGLNRQLEGRPDRGVVGPRVAFRVVTVLPALGFEQLTLDSGRGEPE